MEAGSEKKVVLQFIEALNNADIEEIANLMSEDHVFIDSGDGRYTGKETMKQGWIVYFNMFPDYKIEPIDITEKDSTIGVFGYASGSYKGNKNKHFRIPASWKAVVENGKIKSWQVYCEMKDIERIVGEDA